MSTRYTERSWQEALHDLPARPDEPNMRARRDNRRRVVKAALSVFAALLVTACGPVVVERSTEPLGLPANRMQVGISHTDSTVGSATATHPRNVEMGVLGQVPVQNSFLMGWGTGNPEPSPGHYDWASLDQRVALALSTGAEPTITLCCAPDWMKGQPAGTTDWNLLDFAPLPDHYDDFAALAAQAAARYPQVTRFQVWNEMKGFHDPSTNAWNSEAYTTMYNEVYHAVKAVRSDALVGGPYAPLDLWSDANTMSHPSDVRGPWGVVDQRPLDVLEYWLAHNEGADFVTLDGWIKTRDQGLNVDPFVATDMYRVMTEWLRARTDLPIWWSEVHVNDPSWSLERQDAVTTTALVKMAQAGAELALLWSPQEDVFGCAGCLWSDPADGPVEATPLSQTVAAWAHCVPLSSTWLRVTSAAPERVAASATGEGTFVVNMSGADLRFSIGASNYPLVADGVTVVGDGTCQR